MSIELINATFKRGPRNPSQLLVMVALADNANDQGVCWPRLTLVARKSRVAPRTAMRILERLEKDGWLTIERRSMPNTRNGRALPGLINTYQLNLERLLGSGDKLSRDEISPDKSSRDSLACESAAEKPPPTIGKPVKRRLKTAS